MFALSGISINPYHLYTIIDFALFRNLPQPLFIIDFTGIHSPHFHASLFGLAASLFLIFSSSRFLLSSSVSSEIYSPGSAG